MAMISVSKLTKKYDTNVAVDEISFELEKGKCVALLGPNGAGKTTTLRMLAGLIKPTDGNIHFEGQKDFRSFIGYLPQFPTFHQWMTAKEFLVYVGQLSHLSKEEAKNRADELCRIVGIEDAKNRRISKFSGGMKQRLGIAQAMIHQPKLIMLDEPVSALDPIGRREVLNLLDELKKETTILFSTHILNDTEEICDELLLMNKGKIIESGTLDSLREKNQMTKIDLTFKDMSDEYTETLKELPSVLETNVKEKEIEVIVSSTEKARKEILELVSSKDWPLIRFEVGRLTLEELFMKAVNGNAMANNL